MAGSSMTELIQDAAQRDVQGFSARIADVSLEVAVDTWLRRVVRRKATPIQRARLVKAVERGSSPETKDIQLTRAALLRAAGLDERSAAAAAIEAGATFTEVGSILGMTQQGASARIRPYLNDRAATSGPPA
ncbi:Fis family transcriptional regulator [Mycobacterium paragordonae]|nr:Fis family transcriptional regulator [Mycobacterium paragordonae]